MRQQQRRGEGVLVARELHHAAAAIPLVGRCGRVRGVGDGRGGGGRRRGEHRRSRGRVGRHRGVGGRRGRRA